MSAAETAAEEIAEPVAPASAGKQRKLLLLAGVPLVLAVVGAGAWFSGVLPRALGWNKTTEKTAGPPVFLDLPEMVANLNSDPRQPRYIKLKARLEMHDQSDLARATAVLPRLQDLFQTYLREQRPEDLQGAMGTYRLREELIARADVATAPARVDNVLFIEMLVQ